MADVTFTIGFQDNGTPVIQNLKREVEGIGPVTQRATTQASGGINAMGRSFGALQGILGALGIAAAAKQFIDIADTAKLLEGRLKLVTSSQAELVQVQDALFASAQRTRTSYEGTVDLYTRLARNSKELGASQTEMLQVTEAVNKAVQLSGVSAASATAALVQLGQGFASGTLRGEELNSVMEQTPRLAEAIATGMGITIGQLRALGQEGKLTGKAVFDAIKSQIKVMDEEFSRLPITVGQSLTQIQNSLLKFIGSLDATTDSTSRLAEGIHNIGRAIDWLSEQIRASTLQEEFSKTLKQLDALEGRIAGLKRLGDDTTPWLASFFGDVKEQEANLKSLTTHAEELANQLKGRSVEGVRLWQISNEAFLKAGAGFDELRKKVAALTPEQERLQKAVKSHNEQLKHQAETMNLSGAKLAAYESALTLATTGSKELAAQTYKEVLALETAKEAKEAATKATQDAATASRKAAADEKKAAADKKKFRAELDKADEMAIKMSIELAKIHEKEAEASQKEAEVNAVSLAQLEEEIQRMQEEGQVIAAGLGPKAELLALEKQIALAQTDRATATDLAAAAADHLNEENKQAIVMLGEERKKVIEATAAQEEHTQALEDAILTTRDLTSVSHQLFENLFDKGGFEKSLDDLEDFGKELGVRLIEGIAFGKEGLENDVLIPNFSDVFGQNGIVGGILGKSGLDLGSLFGSAFNTGASSVFDNVLSSSSSTAGSSLFANVISSSSSTAMGAAGASAGSTWGTAFVKVGGGILNKFLGGGSGAAGMGSGLLSLGGGLLGGWAGGQFAGMAGLTDSSEGQMGATVGGLAGGIVGGVAGGALLGASMGSFAGPIGTVIGAIIGTLLGAFAGDLFKPTTTSGTLIRKGIKDYFKEIKVSFAKEVNSGKYFFDETKDLADQMFGGDFLKASKEILTTKAGPDLAKQLQALGTVLTADSAIDLKKSVEQTGTTFGNMLVANLGIDEIPAAITEIVQKSKLSFGGLTDKLTEVFEKGKISAEFYNDAIQGAVDIFFGDLPAAIHVSDIALRSFTDGIFDLEKFNSEVEQAVERMNMAGSAMGQALADGINSGQSRAEVEAAFEDLFKDALRTKIITEFIEDLMEKGFAGFDFSQPIDASSDAMARLKSLVGDSYDDLVLLLKTAGLLPEALEGSVDSADSLLDRIRELRTIIQDLVTQRIEIRLQLLDDLVTLGLTTALDAIATRIQSIQDQIENIMSRVGVDSRTTPPPLSTLTDADLTQLIQLNEQLRNAILSRYQEEAAAIQAAAQAQIAAIRAEYAEKRAAIQAEFAARRTAIQAEFDARREAIQAEFAARRAAIETTITQLQELRTATQELYQAQIEAVQEQIEAEQEHIQALQDQLQIAEQFGQVVESITDIIRSANVSAQSPLDPQQQLGFLQREESGLRAQLVSATGAERARLMQELAQILQQQLQFVDRNTVNGQQLFAGIMTELTALRAEAVKEADKAAGLQAQIAAATANIETLTEHIAEINTQMEFALENIDAQIETQQKLLAALSAQEQAQLAALSAQEQAQLAALATQEQAQLAALAAQEEAAIHAVEATAEQQLTALRNETAKQLTDLAIQQDLLVQEQLRRAEAQLATAKEQLIAQVGAEEAANLLAAGDQAQLIVMTQTNNLLFAIDQHIVDLLNNNPEETQSQSQAPTSLQQQHVGSEGTSAAPPLSLNFMFAPAVTLSVQGGEDEQVQSTRLKAELENTLRLSEQRVKRLIQTDWVPIVQRAAEGKM